MKSYNVKQYNVPAWQATKQAKQDKKQAKQLRNTRQGKRQLWEAMQ
jgi:hypothetical protein